MCSCGICFSVCHSRRRSVAAVVVAFAFLSVILEEDLLFGSRPFTSSARSNRTEPRPATPGPAVESRSHEMRRRASLVPGHRPADTRFALPTQSSSSQSRLPHHRHPLETPARRFLKQVPQESSRQSNTDSTADHLPSRCIYPHSWGDNAAVRNFSSRYHSCSRVLRHVRLPPRTGVTCTSRRSASRAPARPRNSDPNKSARSF